MFNFQSDTNLKYHIKKTAKDRLTDKEFVENEISRFKSSKRRKDMIDGENYFIGRHDILFHKRMVIGENGELEEVKNLPNNLIVDNQYKKMVNQKVNYLLGQPIAVHSENHTFAQALKQIFNKRFQRLIKNVCRSSLNCGIGWLFIYYDEYGQLAFKRFKPYEVIPGWSDEEHTVLDYAIRIYEVIEYEGKSEKVVEKVEVYHESGINRFNLTNGNLTPDEMSLEPYFTSCGEEEQQPYNWLKIPLIPFKYNSEEIPLIRNVKSLQNGLNSILSNFQNNMEEDARNTILVLVNYDGEKLNEFRKNLLAYGAIKVNSSEGANGDVRTLKIEVDAENYRSILEIFKKAIIENAMGYDAKDDRLAGNPNQMNIQSMYSDIDLDANEMETEYQASFEELLWFVAAHFSNMGIGSLEEQEVEVTFNRDIMISESEVIDNCQKSVGLLSDETLVSNHPWIDDLQKELDKKAAEKKKELDDYAHSFNPVFKGGGADAK